MKKRFIIFILFIPIGLIPAQEIPEMSLALDQFGFQQEFIFTKNDTLSYFLRKYKAKPKNLVVFIQGTDANPIFSFSKKEGVIAYFRWFNTDYESLDSTYTYAIIPKPGISHLFNENKIKIPKEFYKKNYLEYRVNQIDKSINHIVKNHLKNKKKVIVYGHSEGAAIGAALSNVNKNITHLGFWSGNVLHNFYEFSLFSRHEALKKNITDTQAHNQFNYFLNWYKSVIETPNATEIDNYGFTNKRWFSYEKPPIDYLLELEIPIYSLFATKDQSTPIETAYLLPIRFVEKRKRNLTFKVCIDCDHAYRKESNPDQILLWTEYFVDFIQWTDKTLNP